MECFRESEWAHAPADPPVGYSFGRCLSVVNMARCRGLLYSVPKGCVVVLEEVGGEKGEKFREGGG